MYRYPRFSSTRRNPPHACLPGESLCPLCPCTRPSPVQPDAARTVTYDMGYAR